MSVKFVCVTTEALEPVALTELGTSPLTLLLYLQTLVDFGTGERTLPYSHGTAAAKLGVDERTIRDYFGRLVKAGLIVARRLAHGVTFAITHQPDHAPERKESSVHFQTEAPADRPERKKTPVHDRTGIARSALARGESRFRESESESHRGGRGNRRRVDPQRSPPPLTPRAAPLSPEDPPKIAWGRLLEASGHDCRLQPRDKTAILHCKALPEEIVACFDDTSAAGSGRTPLAPGGSTSSARSRSCPTGAPSGPGCAAPRADPASPGLHPGGDGPGGGAWNRLTARPSWPGCRRS